MPVDALEQLKLGAEKLGIELTDLQFDRLMNYVSLLQRWSKVINLTAVHSTESIVTNHLLDSLSVMPHLKGTTFIDVGTGAGLPGIVLAICNPDWQLILVDSLGKRCRFLHQVCIDLSIKNVTVVESRAEVFSLKNQETIVVDGVLTRAFASLVETASACHNLIDSIATNTTNQEVHFYSMKGIYPEQELENLSKQFDSRCNIQKCHQLEVPYLDAERHLIHFIIK